MELVGIIRCPVHLLLPYGEGRQIDPDAVRRLAKCFDKTECRRQEDDNFVRGIVTYDDLRLIISALNTSESALKHTILQKQYPLLSDRPIACLDGRHRIRAAMRHEPMSWWVVKLLCVQGSWVDFPRKIALVSVDHQAIQDKIEATSREVPYSDAEIYRLLRKYKKQNDKLRFKERLNRLSAPKQISVKGFLKRELLVQDLDALLKFPGVVAGLQFGNVHKHLALHIDENISRFLKHILQVWEFITNDEPRINSAVDIQTVRCLQFRAPISSYSDRIAIHRMFNEGLLFEGLKDLDLREQVRKRVLSVQVIIPSMETFHENMKYISIGAKILRKYLMETPIRVPGEPRQPKLTVFESLASCWSAEIRSIEVKDGEMSTSPEAPSAWFAYETVFLAALRDFARLSSEHPRQDVRGETMPAFAEASRIASLGQLAHQLGFKNSKIQEMLAKPYGHPTVGSYECKDGRPADWRAGIPFTKSYSQLRVHAFIPMLDSPVSKGDDVSPLFVIRDTFNAFFRGSMVIAYGGFIEPLSIDFWASNRPSRENCVSQVEPQDISMRDLDEDIIMGENEAVNGRTRKHKRLSTFNVLRPKSCRIEKEQKKPQADETIIRSSSRSPPRIPEVQDAEHEPVLDAMNSAVTGNTLTGTLPHAREEPGWTIVRQDDRDPLLLDEERSQDQPLTNAEITRDAQMDPQEEPSDSSQTILRQDHRDPLPCDDRQDVVLADNHLTGNHQGHSKTEQIRDASESKTSEPLHQEMTQFESEEDLFDLSNNSDAGPEETVEIVDQGGPSLTGEEQTRTIERQDQRSPPPMHDMGEEPATHLIGQSKTNEGQAGREPDRLQDATLRKSREEAPIKQELLQTMEHLGSIARREERTPPPMQDNAGEGYEQSPSLTQDATTQDARIQISEPESTTVSAIPTQQITEQLETIPPRTQPHGPNTHEEEKRGKKREREVEVDTETDPSLFPLREREQEFQRHLRVRRDERLGEETSIRIRPLRRLQPQRPQKKARLE
ncbi:hypothetical protein BFJ63_vAg15001 [Fusarium oxysporum f. sp. narcissi]|uniref:Uncharacterized protein n=1 Tax=Fusarium oxysporum f. sp. narcissi TaxID=451672 RepID=A0A4Q2V4X9_FUSOX|nr:hypothetical protein BFJ63_vAg15001 [Fusarium oxysporum f. sp. narcissi]